MKFSLKRSLFSAAVLILFMALVPALLAAFLRRQGEPAAPASSAPSSPAASAAEASAPPSPVPGGVFRVWDVGAETLYTLTESDFLRGAVLCEMSFEAPAEALKAQAVATATYFTCRRAASAGQSRDFTCDSEKRLVYMTDEAAARYFGADWPRAKEAVDAACAAVRGQRVLYDGEPAETLYFAVSAGCTRPYSEIASGNLPYLSGVACPFDLLWDGYLAEKTFSADEIRAAFPELSFSGDTADWFGAPENADSGYVARIAVGGETLSGDAVREALGLRSASFTVENDGDAFTFTTRGWGQGVGMSQAGAIYLAELGADYRDILAYFYPGTEVG